MEKSKASTEPLSQLGEICKTASEIISKLQSQPETKETDKVLKDLIISLVTAALKVNYKHKLHLKMDSDSNLHLENIEDKLTLLG
jgi:hypothetical protein